VDWFSRQVLPRRVSIGRAVDFFLETVEKAPAKYGRPEIFNTGQGKANLPAPRSPACGSAMASRSAWTAKEPDATTSSVNVFYLLSIDNTTSILTM